MNPVPSRALKAKIYAGERITAAEAVDLFAWDILELGLAADFRTGLIAPGNKVGFIIDRIINFTNKCAAACRFCAFHAQAGTVAPYELSHAEILTKVEELVSAGGTQVMLQGGLHPDYDLHTYAALLQAVKGRFPDIVLHCFSPAELVHMARKQGLSLEATLTVLMDAGLDSMPGASDLLVDRIRSAVSPRKLTTGEWCAVMDALGALGLSTSATMTYGLGETVAERVEHLHVIRAVQDRHHHIRAFIPWSFSPGRTGMEDMPRATGIDYLKVVAVARIFLDNVKHIQAGWLTEGLKLAQLALAMGANDMGGVLTEEVVVSATGAANRTSMAEFIAVIRDAGRVPFQRTSDYTEIRCFA